MKRKRYTQEYKDYVSKLVVEEGRKMSDLSFELEIPKSTLARMVKEYRENRANPDKKYVTPSELEKLQEKHDKEMKALKEENEILKKAMHIFSKNPE